MSESIESAAEELLDHRVPVDPFLIAKRLGIRVDLCDSLEFGIHGVAFMDEEGRRYIQYNPSDNILRKRFAIAHSIGHHVLGHVARKRPVRDTVMCYRRRVPIKDEQDANYFALALLMPRPSMKYYIERKGETDVVKLANMFKVAQVALAVRLKNIGYLSTSI